MHTDDECGYCGSMLPQWTDIAAALEHALQTHEIQAGLRPMLIQAIREIRDLRRNQSATV
jgi:hypothetical protein